MNGYIKLHRSLLDNPIVMKDSDYLAVWIWILCNAVFKEVDVLIEGKRKTLKPGQLITGRNVIADELHISASKVQRILKTFENEQQIEQQTNPRCRVISVLSWSKYQLSEQQNEQQLNNKWTTSEQQVNTKEECIRNISNAEEGENNSCSSIWRQLTNDEIDLLDDIYEDSGDLIQEVFEDVRDKRKHVDDAYKYVVGYATNVGWRRRLKHG